MGQNQPPRVVILSPQDGNRYDPATIIGFAGEAEDFEQGTLSGVSLVWRSDIDGIIGVGTIITSQLSLGPHTITLTAIDNNGARNSVSIAIEIRDDLWTHYTYANHIGDSAIENTPEGEYLWVGTKGGVVRWDMDNGTYIKYTTSDGLCHNVVSSVAIDNEGNKWFGTGDVWAYSGPMPEYGNGVCRFNGTTWTHYDPSKGDLVGSGVNDIVVDKQGRLWFGAYGGGVSIFDGETWTRELPGAKVNSIAVDSQGNVWVGARNGLSKFDGTNWTFYHDADGWPITEVYVVEIDPHDNVWIGTSATIELETGKLVSGGVSVFDGVSWTTYTSELVSAEVFAIAFDTEGNAWLGDGNILRRFDGVNWTNIASSGSAILTISIDSNGNIWFGGGTAWELHGLIREGLAKFDGNTSTLYWVNEIGGKKVSVVEIQPNGNIWFGTYDGGLSEFDGSEWTTYTCWNSGLGRYSIQDIIQDNNGIWWILHKNGGISTFDGIDKWWPAPAWKTATRVTEDTNGNIWTNSSDRGVIECEGADWFNCAFSPIFYNTANSGLIDNNVQDIVGSNNFVWFLTPSGISRFGPGTLWVSYLDREQAIESNYSEILTTNRKNSLWTVDNNNVWIEVGGEYKKYNSSGWTIYPDIIAGIESDYTYIVSTKYVSEFWKIDEKDNIWVNLTGGSIKYDGVAWTTYYPPEEGGVKAIDLSNNKWFGGFGIWRYTGD